MKKLTRFSDIAKVFSVSLLLTIMQQTLRAQVALSPISGNLYGQAIVACNHQDGYWYVATASSIYESRVSGPAYYQKVYTAPAGLCITGFTDVHYYNGNFRAVLLNDAGNNGFVVMNRINAPEADIPGPNLVQLPPAPFNNLPYIKIASTDKALYVLSQFIGCGIQGYLYVSYDEGQTWSQDTLGNGGSIVYDFAIDSSQNVYTIGPGFLNKQLPNDSVIILPTFTSNGPYVGNAESIFIDRKNRIVLKNWGAVVISNDGGSTFKVSTVGNTGNPAAYANDMAGNLLGIAVDDTGNTHIYSYTDSNTSWTAIDNNFSIANGATVSCFSGSRSMIAGTAAGLFTSNDNGVTWAATNQGIVAEDIFSIISQPFGRMLCTTESGVYYKEEADSVWHLAYSVPGYYGGLLLSNDNAGNIYASTTVSSTNPQPLAKSIDNGFTWTIDTIGLASTFGQGFYLDETGAKHFYVTNEFWVSGSISSVSLQASGSSTLLPDTTGLSEATSFAIHISNMCSDKRGYLYAELQSGAGSVLIRRPISGTQWVIDTAGMGFQYVTTMASSPAFGIVAVCSRQNGNGGSLLFRRAETGWIPVPLNTDTIGITSVSVDNAGGIFVAEVSAATQKSVGTYYTSDAGDKWSNVLLPGMNMQGAALNFNIGSVLGGLVSTGSLTFALTKGNWGFVFETKGTPTGIQVTPAITGGIKVFPNPSSSGLWTLQAGEDLIGGQIEVNDMNGKTVYSGTLAAAESQISSPGLAPGMYILNIRKGEKTTNGLLMKQ